MSVYLMTTGPAEDLEIGYLEHPTRTLPDPRGFPFDKQGQPIPFDQPHIDSFDVSQATTLDLKSNPLPYQRFIGRGIAGQPPRQINQPDFLSINDDIVLQ